MKIDKVELLEFGVFDNNEIDQQQADPQSPTGYTLVADSLKVVLQTDEIELKKGLAFGIKYRLHGEDEGDELAYQRRIIHPDIEDPESGEVHTEQVDIRGEKAGAATFDFYRFDEEYEMKPGNWTFQLIDGPTVLLEKTFVLK